MRRLVIRTALWIALIGSVPVAAAAGVAAFFGAAYASSSVVVLTASAGLVFTGVAGAISAGAGAGLFRAGGRARRWVPIAVPVVGLAVTGLLWTGLVMEPMRYPYIGMTPTEETRYWELPTGSRIAYVVAHAESPSSRPPVVYLHGGPGAPDGTGTTAADRLLAAEGFSVYRYHQVGSGLSSRLDDMRDYTLERHVADLEAIRRTLGAERLILIGGSWGATLAAHYVARYPARVERVVFTGPGAIWQPAWGGAVGDVTDGTETQALLEAITPRFAAAYYLLRINPQAARSLAPDEEMTGFVQHALRTVIESDVGACGEPVRTAERADPSPGPPGFSFYANMIAMESQHRTPDPRPALREVEVPALVVRGECDRVRPEVAREYYDVFRDATFVTVAGAGHSVAGAAAFPEIVRPFLAGPGGG